MTWLPKDVQSTEQTTWTLIGLLETGLYTGIVSN